MTSWRTFAWVVLVTFIVSIAGAMFHLGLSSALELTEEIEIYQASDVQRIIISDEYSEVIKTRQIAEQVANDYEYELHVFDCTDFSRELVDKLEKEGINARCTAGNKWDSEYTNHTWVSVFVEDYRIEVEATGGHVIDYEDYEDNYEIMWEDKCW